MKKVLTLIFFIAVSVLSINAQSTNNYPENPPRFEILNAVPGMSNYQLILDSQTGKVRCILEYKRYEPFFVNDKDLTDGTATRNGRFRILASEGNIRLLDTDDGRCWEIKLGSKTESSTFNLLTDSMLK